MRKILNGSAGSGIQQQKEATETGAASTKSSRWNQSQPSEVEQIGNRNEHSQQNSVYWEWVLVCSIRDYLNADVLGLQRNLYFLTHSVPETFNRDEAKSHVNQYESEFPVQLANYLSKQGYDDSQITILCASSQLLDIRQRMSQCFEADKSHGIRVDTVDNYHQQDGKCDIIILSISGSNNPFLNVRKFEKTMSKKQKKKIQSSNANNICVTMSRAKLGVYIFGNMDFFKESIIDADADCIGTTLPIVCQFHGKTQEISSPDQFDKLAPDGGCAQPCGLRMLCGHTCPKSCHSFDPEHKKVKCNEKCARKCPEEVHGCPKFCFEECDPCPELILRQLPCGHSQMAQCHLDFEKLECTERCKLKLSQCGHTCVNQCGKKCTQAEECAVLTEKILRCGHTMMLKCNEDPLSQQCQQEVQKCWPICGHESSVKCHEDPALLRCLKPCLVPLADCGHPCAGTCSQCRQGRLHLDCAVDCNRILICGHQCRSKCHTVCPPCTLPCETACIHNTCSKTGINGKYLGLQCGERCTPCAQQCANRCAHQRCTKLCSEPCDIEPCVQPCNKLVSCIAGPEPKKNSNNNFQILRPCIGVCGEECLHICAICKPEKLAEIKEIFFGIEDEEDARFVQLQDCKHIFEATGLDKAIQMQLKSQGGIGDAAAIVVIKCPRCSTPIWRSNRYIKELNVRAIQIDTVKKKLLGDKSKEQLLAEWDNMKTALVEKGRDIQLPADLEFTEIQEIFDLFANIRQAILNVQNNEITGHWMLMAENIDRLLLGFSHTAKRICDSVSSGLLHASTIMLTPDEFPHLHNAFSSTIRAVNLLHYLLQDLCELLQNLASRNLRNLADSALVQLSSELGRHNFLITIFNWVGRTRHKDDGDIDGAGEQMLTELLSNLQTAQAFSEQKEELEKMFDDFVRHMRERPVSKEEMVQIKKALGGRTNVTKWYTCSKGHVYGIGNCGQATQESQCIECKETVGGTHHQLVSTSAEAIELNRD